MGEFAKRGVGGLLYTHMTLSQKKIGLLLVGSPVTRPDEHVSEEQLGEWFQSLTGVDVLASVHPQIINTLPGVELSFQQWQQVARVVASAYQGMDGFVVVHAPDNLIRGMQLIALMLGNVAKPVVFTTAPLNNEEEQKALQTFRAFGGLFGGYFNLGLEANIVNAIQFATIASRGFSFVFGNTAFPSLLTHQVAGGEAQIFDTIGKEYSGIVDLGISTSIIKPAAEKTAPDLKTELETNIEVLDVVDITAALARWKTTRFPKGVIVKLENSGNLSDAIKQRLRTVAASGAVVLVFHAAGLVGATQGVAASAVPAATAGTAVEHAGEPWLYVSRLPLETVQAKFMWALGQGGDIGAVRRRMTDNRSGELKEGA